jgi:uncharacterized phiE125 gp8 family phage protein
MALRILHPVNPEDEPIDLAEAKLHLRIDHDDENTLISNLITLARQEIERLTGLCLAEQSWILTYDRWPGREIKLPIWPVVMVDGISYLDEEGTSTPIDEDDYLLDTFSRPARIVLAKNASWPGVELWPVNGVQITLTAGYNMDGCTGSEEMPMRYRQAMLLMIGHYYENREAVYTAPGGNASILPMGVRSLLADDLKWVS